MLRYGEYSPNNPQLRVTTAPYIGLGEYEQKRNYFLQKQRAEYLRHLAKVSVKIMKSQFVESKFFTMKFYELIEGVIIKSKHGIIQNSLSLSSTPKPYQMYIIISSCLNLTFNPLMQELYRREILNIHK